MNELSKKFQKTTTASQESLMQDARVIIDQAQAAAYRSVNEIVNAVSSQSSKASDKTLNVVA